MNRNKDHLIKEALRLELKQIPNQNFTTDTVRKIRYVNALQENELKTNIWIPYFTPSLLYVVIILMWTIVKLTVFLTGKSEDSIIIRMYDYVSSLLFHPVIISVVVSLAILYMFDRFLLKRILKRIT